MGVRNHLLFLAGLLLLAGGGGGVLGLRLQGQGGEDGHGMYQVDHADADTDVLLEEDVLDYYYYYDQANYSIPVPDMVRSYGYECEIHNYMTEDGYENTLHRIPPRPKQQKQQQFKRQSVFLQHGLLGTSADYVMGCPEKSLGYLLADMGYDVWMGNARGNAYSRNHVNLTIDDDDYWRFSFDEMGKYDLPAAFTYVLQHQPAGYNPKLVYIGHSMGTTMFWVAANEREQLVKDSVRLMVAMGPVAKVTHVLSPISLLAPFINEIQMLFKWLGVREFSPSSKIMQLFDEYACDLTMRQLKVCENVLFLLTGYDAGQMNMTMLPIILGHEPGGTSTRTVIHFAQLIKNDKFQKYDHGVLDNLVHYNQTFPPEYSLEKVGALPVALMWSDNDWLADPTDVKELVRRLPNVVENYEVPMKKFNHVDFLWGLDANKLVFDKIFQLLAKNP